MFYNEIILRILQGIHRFLWILVKVFWTDRKITKLSNVIFIKIRRLFAIKPALAKIFTFLITIWDKFDWNGHKGIVYEVQMHPMKVDNRLTCTKIRCTVLSKSDVKQR